MPHGFVGAVKQKLSEQSILTVGAQNDWGLNPGPFGHESSALVIDLSLLFVYSD